MSHQNPINNVQLDKANNLSDVPNKPLGMTNLSQHTIDIADCILFDLSTNASINWDLRQAYANDGSTLKIDWSDPNSTNFTSIQGTEFAVVPGSAPVVNYITVNGAPTGNSPIFTSVGTDTDVAMTFMTQGAGGFDFTSTDGNILNLETVASSVNSLAISNSATGNPVVISASGSDTNVSLNLVTQGTGQVLINGVPIGGLSYPTIIPDSPDNRIYITPTTAPTSQGVHAIAIGDQAGHSSQNTGSISIGYQSGQTSQNFYSVAIGYQTGQVNQGQSAIAIGNGASFSGQGNNAIALGNTAGGSSQGLAAVAIGLNAGDSSQGNYAVAIGNTAGQISQGLSSVAIGDTAGNSNLGNNSIAIGLNTIATGTNSISIGNSATTGSHVGSVAIGNTASTNFDNEIVLGTSGGTQFAAFQGFTSCVNYLAASGTPTTESPILSTLGSDTNIGMVLQTKGVANFQFAATGVGEVFEIDSVASSVNYLTVASSITGSALPIKATGTDTNISVNVITKGTGQFLVNGSPLIGLSYPTHIADANGRVTIFPVTNPGTQGNYSVTIGNGANCTGLGNVAVGSGSDAGTGNGNISILGIITGNGSVSIGTGSNSDTGGVAIGNSAGVNNTNAISIGTNSFTSGLNSIAIGNAASDGTADNSTIIGSNASSAGGNGVAIGVSANSSGASAIAIGLSTVAGATDAIAIGDGASATGISSVVIGVVSTDGGNSNAVAIGNGTTAGNGTIAIGVSAYAPNNNAIAIGNNAQSFNDSIAIGLNAYTNNNNAIAIGLNATTGSHVGSVAIGNGATNNFDNEIVLGTAGGTQFAAFQGFTGCVNYLAVSGTPTTEPPILSTLGSDTNIGMVIQTKGVANFQFTATGVGEVFEIDCASGDSNYLTMSSSNPGSPVKIASLGSDTDVPIQIQPKGAGYVQSNNPIAGFGGFRASEAANGKQGQATLAGGTVTVSNINITANSKIIYSVSTAGGTQGFLSYTVIAGTSFTFNSSSALDTSTIVYEIFEPA